jgi:uncharacterized membrane protein YkoI
MKAFCLKTTLMSLLFVSGVGAQPMLDPGANFIPDSRAEVISSEDAALQAQARYGGRVLSVQLDRPRSGPPVYRVKLLSNGNVRVVSVDAEE